MITAVIILDIMYRGKILRVSVSLGTELIELGTFVDIVSCGSVIVEMAVVFSIGSIVVSVVVVFDVGSVVVVSVVVVFDVGSVVVVSVIVVFDIGSVVVGSVDVLEVRSIS